MNIAEKILRAKADYDEVYEAGKKAVGEVLKFTDVASTAYRSIVPNGVEPFAKVNKIGGMSYKSKNLLEYPYADTTETSAGITFTDNGDGSITLNGTNDGLLNSAFYLFGIEKQLNLSAGTYKGSVANSIDNSVTLMAYDGTNYISIANPNIVLKLDKNTSYCIYVQVEKGNTTVFDNVTIYPMLNEGETALPYEPYFEGLRSASVSELKSVGENLFNAKNITSPTISVNEDGSKIQLPLITEGNGYTPLEKKLSELCPSLRKGDTVYLKYDEDVPSGNEFIHLDKSGKLWFRNLSITITEDDLNSLVGVYGNRYIDGYNEQVTLLNFRVIRDYATEFKPYIEDTLAIPEEVRSLDGYGLGVNSEHYNYIDFERKVFVKRVKRVVFDGTEDWSVGDTEKAEKWRLRFTVPDNNIQFESVSAISNLLCNKYKTTTAGDTWMNVQSIANHGYDLYIYDENYTDRDVSLWKSHLAELYASGNPLIVDYALAEPIETDISVYLTDEYIEVEGGGTITAVNEYGYDVPTNISYLTDTQGG